MAFDNVSSILSIQSPLSSFKLLCVAAGFSRPQLRSVCQSMLRPFIHDGEISIRYWCVKRYQTMFLRTAELQSDFLSALELCASDTYHLDSSFHPDLVIDGGGNIGMFTLRVAGMESSAQRPPRFVVYEPMPHNSEQIKKHLAINHIDAEVVNACLGGTHRSIPFYCREAISSSFDPSKPYDRVIDMPVHLLKDAIDKYPAERILIKLDIEGMEVEALGALLPNERRPVYVVGELHGVSMNLSEMERIFETNGWTYEFGETHHDNTTFRACSPAALPLLASMASVQNAARVN